MRHHEILCSTRTPSSLSPYLSIQRSSYYGVSRDLFLPPSWWQLRPLPRQTGRRISLQSSSKADSILGNHVSKEHKQKGSSSPEMFEAAECVFEVIISDIKCMARGDIPSRRYSYKPQPLVNFSDTPSLRARSFAAAPMVVWDVTVIMCTAPSASSTIT